MRTVILPAVVLISTAWLCGCSADPYKGATPAPPDRLSSPVAAIESASTPTEQGATGSVPAADGTEALAPNDSGEIPRLAAGR